MNTCILVFCVMTPRGLVRTNMRLEALSYVKFVTTSLLLNFQLAHYPVTAAYRRNSALLLTPLRHHPLSHERNFSLRCARTVSGPLIPTADTRSNSFIATKSLSDRICRHFSFLLIDLHTESIPASISPLSNQNCEFSPRGYVAGT